MNLHVSKKIIFFLISPLLILALADFCQKKTKGFRAYKITKTQSQEIDSAFFVENSSDISSILETPFHYYTKGKSSYVFLSQDGNYVLKFFQSPAITAPYWTSWKLFHFFIPSTCNELITQKQARKNLQFTSYKKAFTQLKEQTGLIYLHLTTSSNLKNKITLYDNIGVKHALIADETAFILQKKAEAFCPYFEKLLQDPEKSKEWITRFALLMQDRALKKIQDKDISPRYNLGVLGDSLVPFDVDSLREVDPSLSTFDHMRQDAKKMRVWLRSKNPKYALFLEEELVRLHQELEINQSSLLQEPPLQ